MCGILLHSSLVVTAEGLPLGIGTVKFWTRKEFKGTDALKRHINPTRVPIEEKESIRWIENLRQTTALLGDPQRCVHIGDRESDIYELFCAAHDLETHSWCEPVSTDWPRTAPFPKKWLHHRCCSISPEVGFALWEERCSRLDHTEGRFRELDRFPATPRALVGRAQLPPLSRSCPIAGRERFVAESRRRGLKVWKP